MPDNVAEVTTVAIAGLAEILKLLIIANNSAVKNGMPPEQFTAIAQAVANGFAARDPENLPER